MIYKVVLIPTVPANEHSKCKRDFVEILVEAENVREVADKVDKFIEQNPIDERLPRIEFIEVTQFSTII